MLSRKIGYSVASALCAGALCMASGSAVAQVPAAAPASALPTPPSGPGDLLVAPTRVELNGFRGTEMILLNIGAETATYKISLEFRRMTPDGGLVEVEPSQVTELEKKAEEIIVYAPRRITLDPQQPQSIRVGVRPPAGLPDGEYRVHMLFRAIPKPKPAGETQAPVEGIAIDLRPIYGITIPVIVRAGELSATAGISNPRLVTLDGREAVSLDLTRTGDRSLYGDIRVLKAGQKDPVALIRGVAIYTEVNQRSITIPITPGYAGSLAGPVTIQYAERTDAGEGRILAQTEAVLR